MGLNLDTMVIQLRAAIGSPKTSELTDVEIEQYIEEGKLEVQGVIPNLDFIEMSTVADQEDYYLADDVITVYKIHRRRSDVSHMDEDLVIAPEQAVITGIYRRPSQYLAHLISVGYIADLMPMDDFVYDRPTHSLKLIPCPTQVRCLVLQVGREWTDALLEEEMVEIVRDKAKVRCIDHLLARRADVMGFKRAGGGVVYVKDGLVKIRDDADKRATTKLEIMSLSQEVW